MQLPKIIVFTALIASSGIPVFAGGKHPPGHHHEEAHWAAPTEAAQRTNPVPASEESVNRGGSIYQTNCAACHGVEGRGDGPAGAALKPPPPDLVEMAPQHSDGDLAWKIEEGRGSMPAWKNTLSQTDIWNVVNYLKQLPENKAAHGHGRGGSHPHDEDKK